MWWLVLLPAFAGTPDRCTYTYAVWDTRAGQTVPAAPVDKPRSALDPHEIGPLGCTPCSEDQRTVSLSNGQTLTACHAVVDGVRAALERALEAGATVESVQGYRPVMSRGELDADGRRTGFSRHAFGVAVDVNREHNGLYDECVNWAPGCRLLQGGAWRPGEDPLSLTPDHPAVLAMAEAGMKWGGAIAGRQKDFMHFSPDGY